METLIRLATAHAKCRLSRAVELQDAVAACDLMNFALYNEVGQVEREEAGQPQQPQPQQQAVAGDKRPPDSAPAEPDENAPVEEGGDKRPRTEWLQGGC